MKDRRAGLPVEPAGGRTSATSVPGNIAEGFGRDHYLDRIKFYINARGSLKELKSHLLIAVELGFTEPEACSPASQLIETLSVKLNNFIATTRRSRGNGS